MPFRALSMSPMSERLTDGIALFALISWIDPSIYNGLRNISELAALMTPPMALLWLVVQIMVRVTRGK